VDRLADDNRTRIVLESGRLPELESRLLEAIRAFEPLSYDPAREAADWLKQSVDTGGIELDTYLLFDEGSATLLGFFAVADEEVLVSAQDLPVMILRTEVKPPDQRQRSLQLAWIARHASSPAGTGQTLFDDVLVEAQTRGAVAVRVLPADEETARRVWVDHFNFRHPRPQGGDAGQWDYLWHSVGEVPRHLGVW
jgi:hypothetical protein